MIFASNTNWYAWFIVHLVVNINTTGTNIESGGTPLVTPLHFDLQSSFVGLSWSLLSIPGDSSISPPISIKFFICHLWGTFLKLSPELSANEICQLVHLKELGAGMSIASLWGLYHQVAGLPGIQDDCWKQGQDSQNMLWAKCCKPTTCNLQETCTTSYPTKEFARVLMEKCTARKIAE